jgi:hypothetical protein
MILAADCAARAVDVAGSRVFALLNGLSADDFLRIIAGRPAADEAT